MEYLNAILTPLRLLFRPKVAKLLASFDKLAADLRTAEYTAGERAATTQNVIERLEKEVEAHLDDANRAFIARRNLINAGLAQEV